jgi:hypothetical protein
MASSTSSAPQDADLFTIEHATSLLMAQLRLDNTPETSQHGKKKGDNEALISDASLALRIQAEDLVNAVQVVEDAQFARVLATHRYGVVNNPTPSTHHREVALSLLKKSVFSGHSESEESTPGPASDLAKLQRYIDILTLELKVYNSS